MSPDVSQISNPFSTGGGGGNFEVQVQASFVALMLAEGFAPCLPAHPIKKIKLQGKHAGYDTDDLIIFTSSADSLETPKLLGQIKHSISITESDEVFARVIRSAWADFNNPKLFVKGLDAIALITGPLSASDIADARTILEWSRNSESAQEFLTKVQTAHFSSDGKRAKLTAFRKQLDGANGAAIPDEDLFSFLKHFHLLGYDLDVRSGVITSVLHSLIGRYSAENPPSVLAQVVQEVLYANQNAGTITKDSLPGDLKSCFVKPQPQVMPEVISKTLSPTKAKDWNTSEFSSALVTANLLGSWNEHVSADVAIAKRLADGPFEVWQSQIRQVLQLPGSPLTLRNGIWAIRDREELWKILGPCVFDSHLDRLRETALTVLKEKDPQFELSQDERFAASIHGKVLSHSRPLRKGIAETLALLGSHPEALTNCTLHKPAAVATVTVREIFADADWILWGSLNDLLPLISEASPDEFLRAVEEALS